MSARAWGQRGASDLLIMTVPYNNPLCARTFSPISDVKAIIEKLENCAAELEEDMVELFSFIIN